MFTLVENEMLEYVQHYLLKNNNDASNKPNQSFRSRFEHTKRVLRWVKYLLENEEIEIQNKEALLIATIFHDIGRSTTESNNLHGERGANIFREYAKEKKMDPSLIEEIAYLIEKHPKKQMLKEEETPNALILLQEADLLDEVGAMGIMFDCMFVGALNPQGYDEAYRSITRFSGRILLDNPMITPVARQKWAEKQELVRNFIQQIEVDLGY